MATFLLAGAPGDAYQGPPELTAARVFSSWTLDVPVLVVVLLAGGLYLAGVRRVRRAGGEWPASRLVAFYLGGLTVLVIATMSFLGVYQGVLFYTRSVQTILLLLVVPLFTALGRPLTLITAALPAVRQAAGRGDPQPHGADPHLPGHPHHGHRAGAVRAVLLALVRGQHAQRHGP